MKVVLNREKNLRCLSYLIVAERAPDKGSTAETFQDFLVVIPTAILGQPMPISVYSSDGSLYLRYWYLVDIGGTMFGYGILGTLLVICLIVWLLRRA